MENAVGILAIATGAVLTALATAAVHDAPDASTAAPAAPVQPLEAGLESEQLGEVNDRLAQLGQQLTAEEELRQEEKTEAAAQHAATLQSLDVLRHAEAALATGDSDGVDEQLAAAEAALSGRTLLDVEAAREALARSDLGPARQLLAAALAERRMRQ